MHVIDMMAMVMNSVIGWKLYYKEKCDGDGDGHCYRIQAVIYVLYIIDVMTMVMDIVIGLKM